MKQSLLLGVATGAATGAIINHSIDRDNSSAATNGALAGAVVGLAASYFIHDGLENRDSRVRRETLLNLDKFNVFLCVDGDLPQNGILQDIMICMSEANCRVKKKVMMY